MTQEEKQLLLKDLCVRIPYRTFVCLNPGAYNKPEKCLLTGIDDEEVYLNVDSDPFKINNIRPYLRPMSSMTEEEKDEYDRLVMCNASWVVDDWLNKNHFDYRGLIEMGLALEATERMYKSMTREEKNMFRDAKFGDKFLTRNGQVMIYQKQAREDVHCLFDEESDFAIEYRPNGDVIYEYTGNAEPQEDDIIKRYVQPSFPSDLDEAAEENYPDFSNDIASKAAVDAVRDAFRAGAEWQKEQMMKEAVEGYVTFNTSLEELDLPCVTVIADEKPMEFYERRGFKLGDKVKIITLKAKEESK